MRILLAVDNSRPSAEAVNAVASRPWPAGTVIRVLTCVPPLMPAGLPDAAIGAAVYLDVSRKELSAEAKQISGKVAFKLTAHDISAHAVVREGEPALEIVREARDWAADLIVVGTHGYTGFKRLFYGSVAQTVVSRAPCSVEVVKEAVAVRTGGHKLSISCLRTAGLPPSRSIVDLHGRRVLSGRT